MGHSDESLGDHNPEGNVENEGPAHEISEENKDPIGNRSEATEAVL